jgi:glycosyltransferase involved in cell wall biosynthesis
MDVASNGPESRKATNASSSAESNSSTLQKLWLRLPRSMSEQLTDNPITSELLAHGYLMRGSLPLRSDAQRLDALLKACRRLSFGPMRPWLRRQLEPFLVGSKNDLARRERVGWERYYGSFGQLGSQKALTTSLVLKAPGPNGEKGVLYCSFEYNWMRLAAHYDAAAVLKDYYLVGATSWSPTDYASMAVFAGLSTDPLFIGVSNLSDLEPLSILRPVVEPLPTMASDWVNPDHFSPKPHRDRTIDIMMVANWSQVKRHWLLFEALRDMPRSLRVVLVGRNALGRSEREIRAEARALGAMQDLEIHTNLETEQVSALLCDSRISAIFTKREGSCVAVPESLFANTPVAMMEEAHVGSKAYINERTGILMRRRGLTQQFQKFLDESESYSARSWAIENISCMKTSQRLNDILRAHSLRTKRPWTVDIAPMCWRYVPIYVRLDDKARLQPAVEELRRKHGVVLEEFPGEKASLARHRSERQSAEPPAA